MHFGYSGSGKIEHDKHEIPNEYLTLCVELIGPRPDLESFCRKHAALIESKVAVYEKMERWNVRPPAASAPACRSPTERRPETAAVNFCRRSLAPRCTRC